MSVAQDLTGSPQLKITPRGLVPDLISELAKFKPALLELLAPDVAQAAATGSAPRHRARQRVRPELRAMMPDDDAIAIGRLLFKLDNGEEIE